MKLSVWGCVGGMGGCLLGYVLTGVCVCACAFGGGRVGCTGIRAAFHVVLLGGGWVLVMMMTHHDNAMFSRILGLVMELVARLFRDTSWGALQGEEVHLVQQVQHVQQVQQVRRYTTAFHEASTRHGVCGIVIALGKLTWFSGCIC